MKIRRFMGRDMNEAMIKVKSELGIDAVILNTRKVKRPGLFGLFRKKIVEVVAAVDEDYKIKSNYSKKNKKSKIENKLDKTKNDVAKKKKSKEKNEEIIDNNTDKKIDKLTEIVANLEKQITNISNSKINTEKKGIENIGHEKYINILKEHDLDTKIAKKIMKQVDKRISINSNSEKTVLNAMKLVIKGYLGKPEIIKTDYNDQKVFLFIGPTGVGKTTTLAKLAAKLSLRENKKVGLITSDTYRIAAVEQLRTYSEILGVPLSVIYETDEMEKAIENFDDKDYILIDTAGRNYKDSNLKNELKGMIKYIEQPEIYLVLSLVADYKNLIKVIESYDFIGEYKIIFTKFDEAVTFGNILNVKMHSDKNLSYITNGQSVPDDIEVLNVDSLTDIIVGDN